MPSLKSVWRSIITQNVTIVDFLSTHYFKVSELLVELAVAVGVYRINSLLNLFGEVASLDTIIIASVL